MGNSSLFRISSAVEQRTVNPLVAGSNPASGVFPLYSYYKKEANTGYISYQKASILYIYLHPYDFSAAIC